jgi:zinc protease
MRRFLIAFLSSLALASCAAQPVPPVAVAPPVVEPIPADPAPLSKLVAAVEIPYESFTLDNGLRVLVHTDRKAPVVAVSVWYGVGSKHEPRGKTGFAHLFEHLMFNGSENAPGDYFEPLQEVGATDMNGTTWFDRTNYFQTVPTGALDRALMLESDRMGHLLGAVTQEKLDNQRSVVQNEKRQGDNQPYGLVEYEQLENLYPSGHPYHHSTIGSMADLNSATLEDVRDWFRDHYGPNNAIIVLAGDIDLATAREKMDHWFGAIPAGPAVRPVEAPVPTLPAPKSKTIKDQVATTRIYRMWAVPGLDNPDYLPLSMSGLVLGGLASSRLDDALVRGSQVAVAVSAQAGIYAQAGQFEVYADVKPGTDPATVAAELDAQIADYLARGPTADELLRATTVYASGQIRSLEKTGGFYGKAPTLAEGLLYSGSPEHYRQELRRAAAISPEEVREVTAKWLSRPAFTLIVEPGTRTEGGENRGGFRTAPEAPKGPAWFANPAFAAEGAMAAGAANAGPDRSKLPPVGELVPLDFPEIERARLSNGIPVYFARRGAVPVVSVRVTFDAGYGADPKTALGTQALLLRLMNEGTEELDSSALARERERLGASITGMADADTTAFQLNAVTPNLAPSLELLADYVRRPALTPAELERVRVQQLSAIRAEMNDPRSLATRTIMPILYGPQHPYGIPPSGTGDPAVVAKLTRSDLAQFHHRWYRPDTAAIYVVGDTTLAETVRLLEASFGDWQTPPEAAPVKDFSASVPPQTARIVLIDRPASPQSMIYAGRVLDAKGTDDLVALATANDVLGGNFLSRLNMNLRETKGWSYGVRSGVSQPLDRVAFTLRAPVQADRTGDSITAIRDDIRAYLSSNGITPTELALSTSGSARKLPGSFETSGDVLNGIVDIVTKDRPDTYYETLAQRYQSLTAAEVDAAGRAQRLGDGLVFVVVGDRKVVEPQLAKLGMPVEVVDSAAPND